MNNILLLTDFSDNSINAINYALHLFKGSVCDFYILHVQSSMSYTTDDLILGGNSSIYDSIVRKSKAKVEKMIIDFKNQFKDENFNYRAVVDFDVLIDSIKQIQKSKNIDLIVMGTNGVTGAKEVIFGSNTINVIRKIDCPTLVIPEGFKFRKPNEVLLPLDGSDSISGPTFDDMLGFVTRFSNSLHLLRVKNQSKFSIEEEKDIRQFLGKIEYSYHIIDNIPIHYAVDCYLQINAIDIVVLMVKKESLFERYVIGSSTSEISKKIRVPLLVLHTYYE